jgi:hypothetical protein
MAAMADGKALQGTQGSPAVNTGREGNHVRASVAASGGTLGRTRGQCGHADGETLIVRASCQVQRVEGGSPFPMRPMTKISPAASAPCAEDGYAPEAGCRVSGMEARAFRKTIAAWTSNHWSSALHIPKTAFAWLLRGRHGAGSRWMVRRGHISWQREE